MGRLLRRLPVDAQPYRRDRIRPGAYRGGADGRSRRPTQCTRPTVTIYNPATGLPYPGNVVPVSPQAQALLQLYPLPNIYRHLALQLPGAGAQQHPSGLAAVAPGQDARPQRPALRRLQLSEHKGQQARICSASSIPPTRWASTPTSTGRIASASTFSVYAGYRFSRLRTQIVPYFENRAEHLRRMPASPATTRIPANWGPPSLNFSSGIAALSDATELFNRNRTDAFPASIAHLSRPAQHHRRRRFSQAAVQRFLPAEPARHLHLYRRRHRKAQPTASPPAAPTSPTSSSACPTPAPSPLATRTNIFASPSTTPTPPTTGASCPASPSTPALRWDYGAPMTELYGRLVNLDVAPGFTAVAPVLGQRSRSARSPAITIPARSFARTSAASSPASASPGVPSPLPPSWCAPATASIDDTSVYQTLGAAAGPAGAALEEPERAEQRRLPAHAGQRLQALRLDHREHLRRRSQFSRRLRADLAAVGSARSAGGAPDDRNLSRRQRHAQACSSSCPTPIRSAQPTPARCPSGFVYQSFGW